MDGKKIISCDAIIKDKYLRAVFGIGILILIFGFFLIYFNFESGAPLIIHFDVYKGIDFIGDISHVFGILFSALAMLAINAFLAETLYHKERFLSYFLGFVSLGISVLILMVVSVIISVN